MARRSSRTSWGTAGRAEPSPDQWLVDRDWQWPVLDDDENGTAMAACGGTSYPTMVLVDGNGDVFRRLSGDVPIDEFDQLVGSSTPVTTG